MWGGLCWKDVRKVAVMDASCCMRSVGTGISGSVAEVWEGGAESGMCDGSVDVVVDVEESKGGTGGSDLEAFRDWVGDAEVELVVSLSVLLRSLDGVVYFLNQSSGGTVVTGKS